MKIEERRGGGDEKKVSGATPSLPGTRGWPTDCTCDKGKREEIVRIKDNNERRWDGERKRRKGEKERTLASAGASSVFFTSCAAFSSFFFFFLPPSSAFLCPKFLGEMGGGTAIAERGETGFPPAPGYPASSSPTSSAIASCER